jgi:hypothetical protein
MLYLVRLSSVVLRECADPSANVMKQQWSVSEQNSNAASPSWLSVSQNCTTSLEGSYMLVWSNSETSWYYIWRNLLIHTGKLILLDSEMWAVTMGWVYNSNGETRNASRFSAAKPVPMLSFGRQTRWEDKIKMKRRIASTSCKDGMCMGLTRYRFVWRAVVLAVLNLRVSFYVTSL